MTRTLPPTDRADGPLPRWVRRRVRAIQDRINTRALALLQRSLYTYSPVESRGLRGRLDSHTVGCHDGAVLRRDQRLCPRRGPC